MAIKPKYKFRTPWEKVEENTDPVTMATMAERYKEVGEKGDLMDASSVLYNTYVIGREAMRKPQKSIAGNVVVTPDSYDPSLTMEKVSRDGMNRGLAATLRTGREMGQTSYFPTMLGNYLGQSNEVAKTAMGMRGQYMNQRANIAADASNKQNAIDRDAFLQHLENQAKQNMMSSQIVSGAMQANNDFMTRNTNRNTKLMENSAMINAIMSGKLDAETAKYINDILTGGGQQ